MTICEVKTTEKLIKRAKTQGDDVLEKRLNERLKALKAPLENEK